MVRSSAKNYAGVAIVTDPEDYPALLAEMRPTAGAVALKRVSRSRKAFTHTARYDSMIANWLTGLDAGAEAKAGDAAPVSSIFPANLQLAFDRVETLRYGENSHQQRRLLPRHPRRPPAASPPTPNCRAKELSYNNIADADAAWECVKTFGAPACVIIKHANPCGVAIDGTRSAAYEKRSRPIRPRPSAASSPSTAKSAWMSSRP